ncbi:TetR/AcrR family transcriptional regulator [Dactylosporangium roseum]|uniref:TetR/AcrR family transcriptional regulator n=1 Tax=Dactylosporangium roseum TaxID=47989 RepID=A0ABY5Z9K6_9ACTN|nr:TetR/AcrR family transcriptional regulator [Dactylosporangium roseum]UWZ37678.1 TetR/AcrR family transcriptional regulator [Dactylosporangium roseum]
MDEQQAAAARVVRGRNRIRVGDLDDGAAVRAHIQDVALDLFIEEGYDKTSLREIAERLGVTKAALYYHFPTKDDIVRSLIDQRMAAIDQLLEWAQAQPRDERMRLEFVRRYATVHDLMSNEKVIRFFERNQTLINTMPAGKQMRAQMERVFDLLIDPAEPLTQQLRRAMAIFSIHASGLILRDRGATPEQRREAALEVALDLMSGAAQVAAELMEPGLIATLLREHLEREAHSEQVDAGRG